MSDLIRREDLIDWLTSEIIMLKGIYGDLGGVVNGVREMVKVMPSATPNNHVHLCEFCKYDYPECQAEKDDVVFGNSIGHDNVYACAKFEIKPERKNGKWIYLDECANAGYYCDQCNKRVVKDGWSKAVKKINFCPNCGADMRGE